MESDCMALVILSLILFIVAILLIGFASIKLYYSLYPKEQKYDYNLDRKRELSKINLELYKVQKDIEYYEEKMQLNTFFWEYYPQLEKLRELEKKLKEEMERD